MLEPETRAYKPKLTQVEIYLRDWNRGDKTTAITMNLVLQHAETDGFRVEEMIDC